MIVKLQKLYSKSDISQALIYCIKRQLFSAIYLKDTFEFFSINTAIPEVYKVKIPDKYNRITAEVRAIDAYTSLLNTEAALNE